MKRIVSVALVALLVMSFSTSAFAHSHLHGSNPADGDVVTESLNEIVLEFDGQIEEGSFIEVTTTEGEAVEVQDIIIGEGTLTGTVAEPLANDDYQVNWSIISADGHPLEGEFAFTVDAEVPEAAEEEESAESEAVEEEATEEPAETDAVEEEQPAESTDQVTEEEDSSISTIGIIIAVIVVILIFGFFLRKRKK